MFIKNYGLFWRADEINWNPGKGAKGAFRLLGRRGSKLPKLRLADFRLQQGIYILYGNHGPHYVGLTRNAMGIRLKDHRTDQHSGLWDRFSWFGFCAVLKGKDEFGLQLLKDTPRKFVGNSSSNITDVEALLIRAMGLHNINQNKFAVAKEWAQVKLDEVDGYMAKV